MQSQAVIKQLTPMEVFDLTLNEVEKAIGDQLENKFVINIPEGDQSSLCVLAYNVKNPDLAAVCFVKKDKTAHVVCYPGVDTENPKGADISLHHIVNFVDEELKQLQDISIKKHFIVSVYAKTFLSENHFVAITEINNKLTVVNPKGVMISKLSNPEMDYIRKCIPDISEQVLAADIQETFDTESCGYIVAAIHAKTACENVYDFEKAMKEIDVGKVVQAYVESRITAEFVDSEIVRMANFIFDKIEVTDSDIKNEKESIFSGEGDIKALLRKKELLNMALYCLAEANTVLLDKYSERKDAAGDFAREIKDLVKQKSKYPGRVWTNFFQPVEEMQKTIVSEEDFDFVLRFT